MLTPAIRGVLLAFLAGLLLMGLFTEEKTPTVLEALPNLITRPILGISNLATILSEVLLFAAALFGVSSVFAATRKGWHWVFGARLFWLGCFSCALVYCLLDGSFLGPLLSKMSPLVKALLLKATMALGMTSLFTALFLERQGTVLGSRIAPWFPVVALLSVVYLGITASQGDPDQRLYTFVVAYPIMVLPLILSICPLPRSGGGWLLASWFIIIVALFLEVLDPFIFQASGGMVSGHALFLALLAISIFGTGLSLRVRSAIDT